LGLQVPGLPAGWLADRVSDLERLGNLNVVPVNSVVLPGGNGNLEVDLELRLAQSSLLGWRRQEELLGITTSLLDALNESIWISLATRFAGAIATPAELDALFTVLGDELLTRRRKFLELTKRVRDTTTLWPILAASIDYHPSSRELELTPQWALMTEPLLAIKSS
jgi:hypothetical protein